MPIYKDEKRNTWGCRTYITDNKGKRRQVQRTGFKTKAEAKNAEIKLLEEANKNFDDITFQQLYEVFIKHKRQNLKFQSIRAMESRFEKHILPYFKEYKISKINNSVYIDWKDQIINKGYSYKYNCNLHIAMVGILNYAIDFYDLKSNIASRVGGFPKKDYIQKTNFWTYQEFKQFIKDVNNQVYYSLFTVLYYTGMRLGECLALNWNDIKDNTISITKTIANRKKDDNYVVNVPKTESSIRKIKLTNQTIYALYDLKTYYSSIIGFNNDWFVFGGIKPLSTTTIERKKNEYCKIANVKQIRIHDFRHSHATLLLSKGIPVTVISKRLGHSNTATTLKIYSHLIPEDEDRAIELLNKMEDNYKIREFQGNEYEEAQKNL